jgi:exopolysaccharide biosynthesis predicted pyruvyltransferase EpsI
MYIEEYLKKFEGKKTIYKANPGNGGDAIIAFAAFKLFKKVNLNYSIANDNTNFENSDVLYAGGGNLIEEYDECAKFIAKNHKTCRSLTILPHTVSGHYDLLSSLGDNVTIICREETSFAYVKSFQNIKNVLLMDDLAVSLTFDQTELKTSFVNRLLFLFSLKDTLWYLYYRKRPLSYYVKNRQKTTVLNSYRMDVEKTSIEIPSDNLDVSATFNFDSSMRDEVRVAKTALVIASFLNQFDVINTNRLHICICGAILGKKINFSSNSYWKNESIYQYSLKKKFPNINWIK